MKNSSAILRAAVPRVLACAIALGWLNQGATLEQYRDLERRTFVEGTASLRERIEYPFSFLYRRSGDEELYYATANAIRGLPRDEKLLAEARGPAPEEFRRKPPADGRWHVPYREVAVEYPALVLPFILLPSFLASDFSSYAKVFGVLMGACLLLACWFSIEARDERDETDKRRAWWLASAFFLALGALVIQRLDAVVALALAVASWATSRRKIAVLGVSLGLATAAKFVPILLVPPLLMSIRHEFRTARTRAIFAAAFAASFAFGLAPMLAMDAGSLVSVVGYHGRRGLQVESTLATLVGLARLVRGTLVPASFSFGSYNLTGETPDLLAKLATPLMLFGACYVTRVATRSQNAKDRPGETAALAMIASLASVWLFGKVFSPQYLTWALPLVLVPSMRRGRAIAWTYFAALLLTQVYLRGYYDYVYGQSAIGIATLLVRQTLVAALAALLLRALEHRSPAHPIPVARMSRERRLPFTSEVDAHVP